MNPIDIKLRSLDGKTVRVEFDGRTLTDEEAHDFAFDLVRAAGEASNKPDHHQNHVNLLADCPLCVYEAGAQTDRLTYDDEPPVITTERFQTLATGKWVVVEQRVGVSQQKRTLYGTVASVRVFDDKPVELQVVDKRDRVHWVDISRIDRLITGGENGITLVERGELAPDYRLVR